MCYYFIHLTSFFYDDNGLYIASVRVAYLLVIRTLILFIIAIG